MCTQGEVALYDMVCGIAKRNGTQLTQQKDRSIANAISQAFRDGAAFVTALVRQAV